MNEKFTTVFPALKSKNFRLYFASQLISLIGTWLQIIAQSWLVLELTHSAFMVGLVSALSFLPLLLFSLFGGVIVDRFPKKELLIFTQASSMVLALILGTLAVLGLINVWIVAVLAFLLGVVNALDMPARQAFTVELVGKEHIPSAIALNMGVFNAARVVGPAIAGFLIARFGNGGAFILNGLSFIAPIIALMLMKIQSVIPTVHPHPLQAIKEGLSYTFNHPVIKDIIIFAAVFSIFGFSYITILPVMAQNIFHKDASGLGIMYTFSGLGSLLGIVLISLLVKKFKETHLIFGGTVVFALAVIAFSFTNDFNLGLATLFIQGVSLSFPFALINSAIQHHVDDRVRGRVMSIYTLAFLGMQPFGSFQIGFLAEHLGSQMAIRIGAIISFAAGIWLFSQTRKD